MNKKRWDWNSPVTWKQSIIGSLISLGIFAVYCLVWFAWVNDWLDNIKTWLEDIKRHVKFIRKE